MTRAIAEPLEDRSQEAVTAKWLVNSARYLRFHKSHFESKSSPLIFGVLGKSKITDPLERALRGKKLNAHPLEFRRFAFDANGSLPIEKLAKCHMLFLADECRGREQEIIDGLNTSVVLSAAWDGFAKRGGVIEFFLEKDNTIGVRINRAAAKRARLKPRADLLKIVEVVAEERPTPSDTTPPRTEEGE